MALGDASSPVRFGKGASSPVDNRELFLSVFGGEVLTAFDSATVTLDKHFIKNLSGGAKSYRFPKTWKASAEYHTPGSELLGNDLSTANRSSLLTTSLYRTTRFLISTVSCPTLTCVPSFLTRWAERLLRCSIRTCSVS